MAGGIQKGTEAGSAESKRLDGDVKVVAEALARAQTTYFYEAGHRNLGGAVSRHKIDEGALPEFRARGITLGCIPDGGMWFSGARDQPRSLRVAFEAKHQGDGGNAIERWCKNYLLCHRLWPDMTYVTFMTGEGARTGGVLHEFGKSMTAVNGPNCVFYYAPDGFSQEGIFNVMKSVLDLDLQYADIKPYLNQRLASASDRHFVAETETQRGVRLAEAQERFELEKKFSEFSHDPNDALFPVWHRIARTDRAEAHEIAIEMMQAGSANAVIATELVECFLRRPGE